MRDFELRKFYSYRDSNYYLDCRSLVFNLWTDPEGWRADFYRDAVLEKFPGLKDCYPDRVADLFARVVMQIQKMDIDLHVNNFAVSRDGDEHVIAVQCLDDRVAEDCARFAAEWFQALTQERSFDFDGGFEELQKQFDKTFFGGPTLYSLIEAGMKRGIPVLYLDEEHEFMWGYGKKQVRGRSTTFHKDSIKDTEFTTYKDMVKDFLLLCGLPTPSGKNCFSEDEAVAEAKKQGFPVVVKPLAGHKGQGVTTGIESDDAVRRAFNRIVDEATAESLSFDGALVEKQIYGTDHRLLAVAGKFAAALERIPAYVDGNGADSIKTLIERENDTIARLDNARSPLCKIKIDDDLKEFLGLQDLSVDSVPAEGERIFLRRVANISAGGVSINVTDKVHPDNIQLVEGIAKYLEITCLGIDVLAEDITKSWRDGGFGIVEINAGPGVFMHLAPAIGEPVDVPGLVMRAHFPEEGSERIPIVAGNKLTQGFADSILEIVRSVKPDVEFGSLTEEGIFFNGHYLHRNKHHDDNVKIMLRNPKLDMALFNHTTDDIYDYGMLHNGADLVILDDPSPAEEVLKRDLRPGGYLVEVRGSELTVTGGEETIDTAQIESDDGKEKTVLAAVEGIVKEIAARYE